jgi:hypothetical protein
MFSGGLVSSGDLSLGGRIALGFMQCHAPERDLFSIILSNVKFRLVRRGAV